ncbi:hypothetical protein PLANPX_4077 [Lacipirellula parvula]|uniref:Uncharacterized protein n=1 Tax=Lacipirellula parvula TaxID=2650471 RepID=A0A5K7XDK0_9BACT|nr:hypothetical protein PLANPX_4077 [Lacipirellula parvula]
MNRYTIPGYVIRNQNGDLTGMRCPLSGQSFWGETCERDQYHHTLAIYQSQGAEESLSIAERKQLYQRGNSR